MRRAVRAAQVLFLLVSLAQGLVTPASAGFNPPGVERHLPLFFEAQAETGPVSLSRDQNATTTSHFKPSDAGPSSGLANQADYYAGHEGQTWEFKMATALDRTYFLNVSATARGTLYWTTAQHVSGSDFENVRFRIDVFSGEQRLGVTERMHEFYYLGSTPQVSAGWSPYSFAFRLEMHRLEPGDVITVKVTRFQGFADFMIGTHGAQQSFLSIPYFDHDPLANAFYLEDGFLSAVGPAPEPEAAGGKSSKSFGIVPVLGLVALVVPARSQRRAALAAVLTASAGLAGCFGGAPAAAPLPTTTGPSHFEEGFEDDPDLLAKGIGELRGVVSDGERAGVPIKGAVVIVLGTNLFATTDGGGAYRFINITPREVLVRVDHEKYLSVERPTTIVAGRITYLNLSMYTTPPPDGERPAYDRPHIHDEWGGETRKQVQSFSWTPMDPTTRRAPFNCYYFFPNNCNAPIPIDAAKPMLPGTTMVEVKLSWEMDSTNSNAWSLMAFTAQHTFNPLVPDSGGYLYGPRGPGQVFRIPIYPHDADPGHQNFTNWHFTLKYPSLSSAWNPAYPLVTVGTMNVEVWIEKGVVALEPKHRRFWEANTTIDLYKESKLNDGSACDLPNPGTSWGLDTQKGMFVPPGTKEIRGWLNWTAALHPQPPAWTLVAKGANYPKGDSNPVWFRAPDESVRNGNSVAFVIRPTADETDKYYQPTSYWSFAPSDGREPGPYALSCNVQTNRIPFADGSTQFTLTAVAVKDPGYEEP